MKSSERTLPWLTALLVAVVMTSCGPSYVGVRAVPSYGYGQGYYGVQPYYGGAYQNPYRYYNRRPVIGQRRTYVVPRQTYANSRTRSYNSRGSSGSRRYGSGNSGGSRGPR